MRLIPRQFSLRYLQQLGMLLVLEASRRFVRFSLIVGLVFLAGWLLYATAWVELQRDVPLPPGVSGEPPRLAVDLLKKIEDMRDARLAAKRFDFSNYRDLFPSAAASRASGP